MTRVVVEERSELDAWDADIGHLTTPVARLFSKLDEDYSVSQLAAPTLASKQSYG